MTNTNVENTTERPSAALVAGHVAASGLGLVKVLLLLAPFAFVAPSHGAYRDPGPRTVTGLDVLDLGANFTQRVAPTFDFWLLLNPLNMVPLNPVIVLIMVPLTGTIAALAILFCIKQRRESWRDAAGLAIVLSALSLAGVWLAFALLPGNSLYGPQDQLLWGGWGLFAADAATIGVLVLGLVQDVPQGQLPAPARAERAGQKEAKNVRYKRRSHKR